MRNKIASDRIGQSYVANIRVTSMNSRRFSAANIAAAVSSFLIVDPIDYWHGASVDRAKLADALSPLPDSAEELKTVAVKLGASSSDIYLGRNATEENVKRLPLAHLPPYCSRDKAIAVARDRIDGWLKSQRPPLTPKWPDVTGR